MSEPHVGFSRRPSAAWAAAATAILLLAAVLRIWQLERLPGGLHFDLAANLFDATEVIEGARPIYFLRNNGREPLVIYLEALVGLVLGVTPFSARLVTVVFGMLSVSTVGFATRQAARLAWPADDRRAHLAALVGGGLMAGLFWSVFFSRFGLRTGMVPAILAASFGLLLRGIRADVGDRGSMPRIGPQHAATRTALSRLLANPWLSYAASGALLGLALDTHTAPRLAPPAIALPLLVGLVLQRRPAWLLRLVVVGLASAIVFAPLGIHYLRHPDHFGQHSYDNFVGNPAAGGGTTEAVVGAFVATASAFVLRGSPGGAENLPGRPILDPLAALAFLAGLALAIGWLRAPPRRLLVAVTLLGWIVLMSLPSALSLPAPAYGRITGAVPAAVVLAALGAMALAERLPRRWGPALLGGLVLVSAAWTARDYFGPWARDVAYDASQTGKADAAEWLAGRPAADRIFLAPLWADDFAVQFLTRHRAIETLAGGLVIPTAGTGEAVYAFPFEDATGPEEVRARLPGQPPIETVRNPTGRHDLLRVLRLPPGRVTPPPSPQRLEDGVASAGADVAHLPNGRLAVTLRWYAWSVPTRDYTVFVQVRDAGGTRAQHDGPPLDGRAQTSRWRQGDLVLDRHELETRPDLAPTARLFAGMYDPSSGKRIHLLEPSGRVSPTDELSWPLG